MGGERRIKKKYSRTNLINLNTGCFPLATSQTTDIAELQRKLDVAGDDIALINMRLDESQGMYSGQSLHIHFCDISMTLKVIYWNMHGCRWCCRR